MSLQDKLHAFKADFIAGKPPYDALAEIHPMARATEELVASGTDDPCPGSRQVVLQLAVLLDSVGRQRESQAERGRRLVTRIAQDRELQAVGAHLAAVHGVPRRDGHDAGDQAGCWWR